MQEPQSYRYVVKNNQLVAMTHDEEFNWVYNALTQEVISKMGPAVFDYMLVYYNNRVYVKQDEDKPQELTLPIELCELSEIAKGLDIVPEDIQLKEYYFHLVDPQGVLHGFDVRDFESRHQSIIDSFANIIDKHFDFQQAVTPIKFPTYLGSSLCDAFILVYLKDQRPAEGELIDFVHPDFVRVNQQTTWVKEFP
jgi:hypothetical protein